MTVARPWLRQEQAMQASHSLFPPRELAQTFGDWEVLLDRTDEFPAADASTKRFATLIARRPR